MKAFEQWGTLSKMLKNGSFSYVDLAFAESVLKQAGNSQEHSAALLAALFALSRQGHLALDASEEALPFALQCLNVEKQDPFVSLLQEGIQAFTPSLWVCREGNHFYLQKNWTQESQILFHLDRLCRSAPLVHNGDWAPDPRLNQRQKQAVESGMQHALSLWTGGPGTGKTFTAASLVKACIGATASDHKEPLRLILTAPTGKAASHLEGQLMKEGLKVHIRSGTLHSILGMKSYFQEGDPDPLFADLIIVDECSMIDAKIFARLLASVQTGTRCVLIGDKDQLPAVEAGSIFADLLDLRVYPTTELTQCLRSESAEILSLAQSIKEGNANQVLASLRMQEEVKWIDLEEEKKSPSQFYTLFWERYQHKFTSSFAQRPTPNQILKHLGEFSILSCVRGGPLGVDALNSYFLNQSLKSVKQDAWWVAPIMVTRNDYDLQLFNGDLGCIVRRFSEDFSMRQFSIDDCALFLDRKEGFKQIPALALNAFEYSFCQSIHKSQGSEYDEVLILIPKGSEVFGREVLYTAVTRAKKKVALAGSQEVLLQATLRSSRKTSGLKSRLQRSV